MSIHEHINNQIWNLYCEFISNSEIRRLDVPKYIDQIIEIERENFSYVYAQDKEDLLDDFSQPKFRGLGLFDENNILQGYIYGYYQPFTDLLDFETFEEIDKNNIKIYDDSILKQPQNTKKFFRFLKKTFGKKNTFYVSNLAINKKYRGNLPALLKNFFDTLKNSKIDYIIFDALSDTQNLMFKKENELNHNLLKRFNVYPIALYSDGDEYICICSLK